VKLPKAPVNERVFPAAYLVTVTVTGARKLYWLMGGLVTVQTVVVRHVAAIAPEFGPNMNVVAPGAVLKLPPVTVINVPPSPVPLFGDMVP
jgi:hypothetical protein